VNPILTITPAPERNQTMPKPVMISVSGIRGIVGDGLTPELLVRYAAAAGTFYGPGKVMVGRDSRVTGEMVRGAVFSALMSVGCDPVDLGIVPTPTVQLATERHGAAGGIVITASHNPAEWNALKLLDRTGMFLDEEQGLEIKRIAEAGAFGYQPWDRVGRATSRADAVREHIDAVLAIPFIDVGLIRKRKFKVAFDSVNGAGGVILPDLLSAFGCEVAALNAEPHGRFSHTPEPLAQNLTGLSDFVRSAKSDVGFAVDPDVDRCAIVSETGEFIGEEYTVTLASQFVLTKKKGTVVVNVSTTRAVDDVAAEAGVPVVRTKVGEIHVAKKMKEIGAAVGGEGNGGVILPEVHLGRDAPVAVALTLQAMAESGRTLSDIRSGLPRYFMAKKKLEIGGQDPDNLLKKMGEKYASETCNWMDGLKIERPDSWIQIRKSNTEPIIRIMTEAKTPEEAERLAGIFVDEVLTLSGGR
jgi:phosphomannomutase